MGPKLIAGKCTKIFTLGKDICYAAFWYEADKMAKEGVTVTFVA